MALLDNLIDRLMVRFAPGGEYESLALRRRFRERHDLDIGLYTIGAFDRWRLPPGTRVGRYCSIAHSVRLVEADHPITALSTHPYFYLPAFGVVEKCPIPVNRQQIGDDVWIGHNAIILPGCTRIGRGAVIGAGALVMSDVPPYAIMSGAPARLVRSRFAPDVIAAIEATRWWELDKDALRAGLKAVPEFGTTPTVEAADRFVRALGRPGLDLAALQASSLIAALPRLPEAEVVALFATEIPGFSAGHLETPLAELPIDSFALINLRVALEAKTGQQLHDTAWGALSRPADLVGVPAQAPLASVGTISPLSPVEGAMPAPGTGSDQPCAGRQTGTAEGLPLFEMGKGEAMPAGEVRRYRINMPQMALRGLSESWLMKELGDLHWSILMRELETNSAALADAAGDRLYATFTRIRFESSAPLTDFRENERLELAMTEERYGAAMFFGTCRITGVRGTAMARLMTTFSKYGEAGANTSLLKGQPVIPPGCRIPPVADLPAFGADYRALRASELPPVLADCGYDIQGPHDINGVGLLYFAAYPAIAEICVARLKGAWTTFETSLVERDISYFANADPGDSLRFSLHGWEEDAVGIRYDASLARASDGRTMARVTAKKARVSLPPPGRPVAIQD